MIRLPLPKFFIQMDRSSLQWAQRMAVGAYFFIAGFVYASWSARLPEIQQFFSINNTVLGGLLFTLAAGALVAMPFAGWMTIRFGSKAVTGTLSLITCILLPFLVWWPVLWLSGIIFFTLGLSTGAMDVAMNSQAVMVERQWKKPIMSSFHAVFSIGMALGAAAGALLTKWSVSLQTHLACMAILGAGISIWGYFFLVEEKREEGHPKTEDKKSRFQLPTKAILPLGIIAFCGMTAEGSMADWSALYMFKVVGQSESFSAFAFGTFALAMTLGRIFGDWATLRLGKGRLLQLDATLALTGLALALFFPFSTSVLAGFFLVGLGLSTIVPIIYSSAGNTEGVAPGVGIAMATTIGYAGFFVGPPVIGFLSDQYGMRLGLGFTLLLLLVMWALIRRLVTS